MKSAQASAQKMVQRAAGATQDYLDGSRNTSKDQAAAAIAGKENWKAGLAAAQTKGSFEKGLQKSGKAGWLRGIENKGQMRFAAGVADSAEDYAAESGRFDQARNAAAGSPRGPKGSPQNLQRVALVVNALRAAK